MDPDDPDIGLAAANAMMVDAGIDVVLEEVQRQYDDWKAAQLAE